MNSDLIDEAFPIVRTRDPIENVQRTIRSENLRFAVDRNTADLITGGQWSTRIDSWWDHEITYSDPEPTRSQRLWAWIKKGFQNE